jgi:hypothetical protein
LVGGGWLGWVGLVLEVIGGRGKGKRDGGGFIRKF